MPRLLGWDKRRVRARVEELLELVSLPADMRDRYPAQLSGGQRQRIGVARALAADPPVMLMDEPFGAIDPINRERLQNQFLRLQSEIRKTIIFVTHDIDEAIKMGDRVAVMQKGGKLAQYAVTQEVLRKDYVMRQMPLACKFPTEVLLFLLRLPADLLLPFTRGMTGKLFGLMLDDRGEIFLESLLLLQLLLFWRVVPDWA